MDRPEIEYDESDVHELVIVRRRSDDEGEEHHSGVWKVAFADFMTAMMAFFLVLWIVNSTSKETRSSLARYFNPVRLSDTTPARKGLRDPKEEDFDASGDQKKARTPKEAANVTAPAGEPHAPPERGEPTRREPSPGSRAAGVQEFADPFARAQPREDAPAADREATACGATCEQTRSARERPGRAAVAAKLLAELRRRLGEQQSAELGDALSVVSDLDGLLISLTDKSNFGMFAIGSAIPESRLVGALEAISEALRSYEGGVIVRGHTDARPYRGEGGDNWQLSSERARAAYQILVRNGLSSARVERIEGYADHDLRRRDAPEAPENRRIEIFVRAGGP